MAVTTVDILIEGTRRDDVFSWLSEPDHHRLILTGAFDGMTEKSPTEYDLKLDIPPHARIMGYRLLGPDDSHGGRRVLCETTGKRTRGKLHYSLRTMKPSTNTMLTLHMDYDPGSMLGGLVDHLVLRKKLQQCLGKVLENARREITK